MKPMLLVAIAIGVAGTILLSGVLRPRPAVHSVRAASQTLERVFASGRIEGRTPEVEIHATITERIAQVQVVEGETVRAGQVLIQLDDERFAAEEQLADAGVRLAETRLQRLVNGARESEIEEARSVYQARAAEFDGATRTLDRVYRLGAGGATSAQSIDDAQIQVQSTRELMQAAQARLQTLELPPRVDEVASLKAEIAAAQARLDLARAMRSKTAVLAPAAGEILQVNVEPGELATPDMTLIVMCDTSRLRVRAEVEELDALHVSEGQAAAITTDGLPDYVIHGEISHIRPRLNGKRLHSERPGERLDSRTREIWIDLISPPDLVIGLPVDVWILPHSVTPTDPQQTAL